MKQVVYLLLFLMFAVNVFSQRELAKERIIEKIYEQLVETTDGEGDFSVLYDDLTYFAENPINLNHTSKDELEKLRLLSDMQIENLLFYIYVNERMETIYELQLVEGMDVFTIELLLPFVQVGTSDASSTKYRFKDILTYCKHQFIARFDGTFEKKQGYRPAEENTEFNNRYVGDPFYTSLKYRFQSKDWVSLGLTCEKDAGEQFWGTYNKGYDFYSGHLQINNLWKFKTIIVGDFKANFGQGLVMSGEFLSGKSSSVTNITAQNNGLKKFSSTDEFNFFRGVGATAQIGNFDITAFYSYRKMDGDTTNNTFTSFKTDGLHRTVKDLERKRTVGRQVFGFNTTYSHPKFKIGLTTVGSWLDATLQPEARPYNLFYFQGKVQFAASLNYYFRLYKFRFCGETAINERGAVATLNSVTYSPVSMLNLALLQRYYSPKYDVFFANAFSENSKTNNENGVYMGMEIEPYRLWKISAYADVFRFPWLRFGTYKPSTGWDAFLQIDYKPHRKVEMFGRFRYKNKESNLTEPLAQTFYVGTTNKASFRYQIAYQIGSIGLKNIVEANAAYTEKSSATYGFLILQDVVYQLPCIDMTFCLRYEFFDAPNYDNRFYVYERDVPYTFSSPALYGKGSRYYIVYKYNIINGLTLYLRLAGTVYADGRKTVGSGLETIQGNTKTDFRIHLQYQF